MSEYVFKLPDLGEGTVESEIAEWFIKVGDVVEEETVVGTMMTDKAAVELSAPVTGTVKKLAGEPGDIVAVGAALVVFETDGDVDIEDDGNDAAEAPKAEAEPATQEKPDQSESTETAKTPRETGSRVITSPANRRRAKEMGIDLAEVPGSGLGGRITRQDFDDFVERGGAKTERRSRPTPATKEIKVIGLRRVIAERMSQAKREIPHFSYVEEIDITELEKLRKHLNASRDSDKRLTLLPFLGLALIRALRKFPQCNATYDKERNLILQHGAVHLGVATQTDDGLKVPVVRNAQDLSLGELADSIRKATEAARDNSASREMLSGSTITITSLGKLGGIASTPVINMPEVGIIGVNRAVERPMVVNGQIAVRLMMNLSTSFDHRFVDGYDAAAFVQEIRTMLENPAMIFIDE